MTARQDFIDANVVYDWMTGEIYTVANIDEVRFTRDVGVRDNWLFRFDKSTREVSTLRNYGDWTDDEPPRR